jgi:protein gp37
VADGTNIEWTEATWNPITGCSVHSPGCTNCYAMKLAGTRLRHHPSRAGLTIDTKAGPVWNGQVRFNEQWLDQPLRWERPRMIFVCAHGDLFHEAVPDEWIDRVFAVMALCPLHTFQVLTKRSARMRAYLTARWPHMGCDMNVSNRIAAVASELDPTRWFKIGRLLPGWPLPNVWLGVSVEDQQRADERVPDLLATPAAVRWLSCEPLLGAVNLCAIKMFDRETPGGGREAGWESALNGKRFDPWMPDDEDPMVPGYPKLDWIVAGGESGPGARPMHPDWARSLRDQCAAAGVPFFWKQWGAWAPGGEWDRLRDPALALQKGFATILPDGTVRGRGFFPRDARNAADIQRIGKKRAGRLLDGVEHNGMPAQ